MSPTLMIVRPGTMTTVQDRGRFGWEAYGVSQGGALDYYGYWWANRLAGNSADAAALEVTQGGLSFASTHSCWLATTGTDRVTVDERPYPSWSGFWIEAGSTVTIRDTTCARAYVAVHGGIEVDPVLGSRSTDRQSGFGGFEGRALKAADVIPIGTSAGAPYGWMQSLRHPSPPMVIYPLRIHVVRGPRDDEFDQDALSELCRMGWTVSAQSSEMGLRLEGGRIGTLSHGSRVSEPMPVGGIQVTPGGDPIVLLAARGTLGGYPLLATATSVSVWKLGQARPGDTIQFVPLSVDAAQAITREVWADLERTPPVSRPLDP